MRPFQPDGTFCTLFPGRELRRTAVRGAGATIGGQAANFILSTGSVSILARLLDPADFGVVAMVTTFGLLFRSFGLAGFTEAVVQREELTDDLTSSLFWVELSMGAVLTLLFAAAGPLMALFYRNAVVARIAVGVSPMIFFGCLGWIHLALLQRAGHYKSTALISFAGQVVFVGFSIGLAVAGWHYWAIVGGIIAQSAVTAAGAWLVCRWVPRWPARVAGTGSGVKFAMNVYSRFAFNYLTRNTDNLMVGWRYGAPILAFYKKAYDLFILPESQLLSPLSVVVISTLSRIRDNQQQFRRFFLGAISVMALVGMGIGGDFTLIGKDIIRLLLGPHWDEAGRIFVLFGPGIGAMLLYNTHGWIHVAIGRPARWLFWGMIEFCCTVTLFFVMWHWGPSGIAFAWTASLYLLMFPSFWYAGRPIGLSLAAITDAIWRYCLAAVIAGCATVWIDRSAPHLLGPLGASTALIRIVTISSIYFVLYVGSVIALHRSLRPINNAVELLRDLLPDRKAVQPTLRIVDLEEAQSTPGRHLGTR